MYFANTPLVTPPPRAAAARSPEALARAAGAQDTLYDCETGPNACGLGPSDTRCAVSASLCNTGQAAAVPGSAVYCPLDLPGDGLPNGAGQYCYASQEACEQGANYCSSSTTPCDVSFATCATGIVATTNWSFFCPLDNPVGATSTGGGQFCYDTAFDCVNGPNACGASTPCIVDNSVCATGRALANPNASYFCPYDLPPNSQPNGAGQVWARSRDAASPTRTSRRSADARAGTSRARRRARAQLCYLSSEACANGTNSCAWNGTPCSADDALCSTGRAAAGLDANYRYICEADLPTGGLPNGAGSLPHTTIAPAHTPALCCSRHVA